MKNFGLSDFFRPDPIPKKVIPVVNKLIKNAKLFRYIGSTPKDSETALLEKDFKEYLGVKYALALNSCSSALYISLICCGVKPGDKILMPSFTFTSVPSAIIHAGATPILVESNNKYCIDIDDLKKKISAKTKVLLLSHMRGHTSDMDKIIKLCKKHNVTIIEDAAHSLGVLWRNKHVGTFGKVGCFSFQSYKIINAGEGGLLVTNDVEIIVKAIYLSGAYEQMNKMHYVKSKLFNQLKNTIPSLNLRMDNISAAIIRSQIDEIEKKVFTYNKNYLYLYKYLLTSKYIRLPEIDLRERMAPDSIQFNLVNISKNQSRIFMKKIRQKGISLYVLGIHKDNSRIFWNWKYLKNIPSLNKTREILNFTCDMRLPLFFKKRQLNFIAKNIILTLNNITKYEKT